MSKRQDAAAALTATLGVAATSWFFAVRQMNAVWTLVGVAPSSVPGLMPTM